MDPEETLTQAEYLATLPPSREHADEIREMLSHYWHWRVRGGFEPENGDRRAKTLRSKINT
jgi:hypothetical protein